MVLAGCARGRIEAPTRRAASRLSSASKINAKPTVPESISGRSSGTNLAGPEVDGLRRSTLSAGRNSFATECNEPMDLMPLRQLPHPPFVELGNLVVSLTGKKWNLLRRRLTEESDIQECHI
jgi:hypothetical protein